MGRSKVKPLIGISVCFLPPDSERTSYRKKNLEGYETELIGMILKAGGLPFILPDVREETFFKEIIEKIDGLILTGGTDIAPESYGEKPIRKKWSGDRPRDLYEMKLLEITHKKKKPVLGLCRGCQLINIYFGGTLYQDIATQMPDAFHHVEEELYDHNYHSIDVEEDSLLSSIYSKNQLHVNSLHHQGIKKLAPSLKGVGLGLDDNLVEAVELKDNPDNQFLLGAQWHPEWCDETHPELDPGITLFKAFINACSKK